MLLRGDAGEPEVSGRKILGARWIYFFGGKVGVLSAIDGQAVARS